MRLTTKQQQDIKEIVTNIDSSAKVYLFGSRADDSKKGGDVDLLVQLDHDAEEPAMLGARVSTRVSRGMWGRKVDVVLDAPNLKRQSIHKVALATGIKL
jgi:predicted nucleotidyltransferase